ncbi:hypothetical protein KY363_02665 [Candidatus Woesearchaeota archaeon]|nr:hypothetical protein [Candidatus Woesearchaeota archaeon]
MIVVGLELRQTLKLEQKLEQRLELKQELVHELKLILALEFSDFITFEDDEDIGLLEESLPFLMLHEVSHPLHSYGFVQIPSVSLPCDVAEAVASDHTFGDVYHHDTEIVIDRSGIYLGQKSCGYALQEMIRSHAAITERVFRDVFKLGKHPPHYGFIARLDAVLRIHEGMARADGLNARVVGLYQEAEKHSQAVFGPDDQRVYSEIVKGYMDVYRNTRVHGGRRPMPIMRRLCSFDGGKQEFVIPSVLTTVQCIENIK